MDLARLIFILYYYMSALRTGRLYPQGYSCYNLTPYCAVVKKSRSLNVLDPSGPAWPVTGVLYLTITCSSIE